MRFPASGQPGTRVKIRNRGCFPCGVPLLAYGALPTAQLQLPAPPFTPTLVFEYWRSSIDRLWYWHLKTAENVKLAQGQPYATRGACLHAIEQVRCAGSAPVANLSPREMPEAAGERRAATPE